MPQYRVTEPGHVVDGEKVPVGETIELSESTADQLHDRVEPVKDDDSGNSSTEQTTETSTDQSGELPEDFPGKQPLTNAGYKTYEDLQDFDGDLTEIEGVGPKTEEAILEALE